MELTPRVGHIEPNSYVSCAAVIKLIIAAHETMKAIEKSDPDGERRLVLAAHLHDQIISLVRPSGYMVDDIVEFLYGDNPEVANVVANVIAARVGTEVVNALGYDVSPD